MMKLKSDRFLMKIRDKSDRIPALPDDGNLRYLVKAPLIEGCRKLRHSKAVRGFCRRGGEAQIETQFLTGWGEKVLE